MASVCLSMQNKVSFLLLNFRNSHHLFVFSFMVNIFREKNGKTGLSESAARPLYLVKLLQSMKREMELNKSKQFEYISDGISNLFINMYLLGIFFLIFHNLVLIKEI